MMSKLNFGKGVYNETNKCLKIFFQRFMLYLQIDIDRSESRASNLPANSKQKKMTRKDRSQKFTLLRSDLGV